MQINGQEIIKHQDSKALAGMTYSRDQIDLIKRTVAKGANDDELKLFLHLSKKTGLDPFAKQIHCVKRWSTDVNSYVMTAQTGIDGYRLIAERTGRYAPGKEPSFHTEGGQLVSATAYVMKLVGDKWFEVAASAFYDEYVAKKKDGSPNVMWATKPRIMLAKCAESLALRRAFPAELSGLYTEDEISTTTNYAAPETEKPAETARSHGADKTLTPGELKYFHSAITKMGVDKEIVKAEMKERFNKSTSKELTRTEADELIKWVSGIRQEYGEQEPVKPEVIS